MIDKIRVKLNTDRLFSSFVFRSGKQVSENHISCASNPYDLRPAADIIVGTVGEMMKDLPDDKPLVILVGEIHSMPAHKELEHMIALRLLRQNEHFTFSFEKPNNIWAIAAKEEMNLLVSGSLNYHCSSFDSEGQASLSAFITEYSTLMAPASNQNLMACCYVNKINTVFSDAALTPDLFLDLKDPFTIAASEEYEKNKDKRLQEEILARGPDGVAIRNLVMAQRTLGHAKEHGIRMIIQAAGCNHVFGNIDDKLPYEDSLCAAYRSAGAAVLPVFITSHKGKFNMNIIPETARPELENSVIISGLAEDQFINGSAEKEFIIEKLHKNSGGELSFYDVAGQIENYKQYAYEHAEELIARAAANENQKQSKNCIIGLLWEH